MINLDYIIINHPSIYILSIDLEIIFCIKFDSVYKMLGMLRLTAQGFSPVKDFIMETGKSHT